MRTAGPSTPAAADPDGTHYTFERGVTKSSGGNGWADVWMRDHFGWEYKGKHRDLREAYQQLLLYREALENPPLLVVCDLDRVEIHTNFTDTIKKLYAFDLAGVADPQNLDILRQVFYRSRIAPPRRHDRVGHGASGGKIRVVRRRNAGSRRRGPCGYPFSDEADVLHVRRGCRAFAGKGVRQAAQGARGDPKRLSSRVKASFRGDGVWRRFRGRRIPWFNGGLFADDEVVELQWKEIETLIDGQRSGLVHVEPSIFGTLFERTLDPAKRSQIGAHFTSRATSRHWSNQSS